MEAQITHLTAYSATQQKVDQLLSLDKITRQDLEDLDTRERGYLGERITELLRELKNEERDKFLGKINLIIDPNTKTNIWEHNQYVISAAISGHMAQYGIMPTKSHIAQQTGLSRQTITKHFKEYQASLDFKDTVEQFKFMNPKMLASVFKHGLDGDMRAARLYFEMTGALNRKHTATVVNEQTNYIQINNTILNQEKLQQLTPAQLNQIERIITNG